LATILEVFGVKGLLRGLPGGSAEGRTLLFAATEGRTLLFAATKGRPLLFAATEGRPLLFAATEGRPLLFAATEGRTLVFTATKGRTLVFTATKGRTLVFTATKGRTLLFATKERTLLFAAEGRTLPFTAWPAPGTALATILEVLGVTGLLWGLLGGGGSAEGSTLGRPGETGAGALGGRSPTAGGRTGAVYTVPETHDGLELNTRHRLWREPLIVYSGVLSWKKM